MAVQSFGETPCIGMIFGKALTMMRQSINRCRGDNANLSHAAAEHFAKPPCFRDEFL